MSPEDILRIAEAFMAEAESLQDRRDKEGDHEDLSLRSRLMRDISAALLRAVKAP